DAVVALASQIAIDAERGAQGEPVLEDRPVGADHEGQRTQQPRRHQRQRAALRDRLARVPEPRRLQRTQAAVRRPLVVEGGGSAEVTGLDERDRQSAPRRRICRREPVDPAADDEDVELLRSERLKVAAVHGRLSYSSDCQWPPLTTAWQ